MRLPEKRKALPADQAEVRTAALITWFRTGIPAFWIPITKGEALALESGESRRGSLEGTITPITREAIP